MLEELENPTPLVVTVRGTELDIAYSDDFAQDLVGANDAPHVVVDMSAVTYMDSTCLSRLIIMQKARNQRGLPPVALVIPSPSVRRILKVVGLDHLWPLFDSVDDAIRGATTFH